ncbi:ATP-binding cassette sub-family C member 9, partial [Stegodyphus mimosarum]
MLENFVFKQLEGLQPHVFLQQDGAPPHWGNIVRSSLSRSVRENLDPGKEYFDKKLSQALEAAHLRHILAALPGGLDAQVSDGGSNACAGQLHLFGLARALIRLSQILLMGKVAPLIDSKTGSILQTAVALYYKDCIVISIAR